MTEPKLFKAIRAIGVEFIQRFYRPTLFIIAAILFILLVIVGWATTISSWWWILEVILLLGAIVFIVISIIIAAIVRLVRPAQTKALHQKVSLFVDTIQELSGTVQTPVFIMLFHVIRDVVAPKKTGSYIGSLATRTASLKADFQEIVDGF